MPGATMPTRTYSILNVLTLIIILLGFSTFVHAKSDKFHSPYFDLTLPENLTLISKTEEKNDASINTSLVHQMVMMLQCKYVQSSQVKDLITVKPWKSFRQVLSPI